MIVRWMDGWMRVQMDKGRNERIDEGIDDWIYG